jgi:ribosomal protein S18 acetylase RimI-like enzyme
LAIFLIDLPPNEMERRLGDALGVYVDAMRYPRGTVNQRAAMWLEHIRRRGWQAVAAVETPVETPDVTPDAAEPIGEVALADRPTRNGFPGIPGSPGGSPNQDVPSAGELTNAPLLGVAYGYPGAPGQWWQQQVVLGLQRGGSPAQEIARLMTSYFELTELHIHPRAQGRGLGEALARRLLAGRSEQNVLLSTPETKGESNRAWRLYRRLGFTDIIRRYHFAGDPRAFAILGRALPL